VFKPRDVTLESIRRRLVASICKAGNAIDDTEVPTIEMPVVEAHPVSEAPVVVGTRTQLDYSLHPLMVGQIFRPEDIEVEPLQDIETSSSGVCLLGINDGCEQLERIRQLAWLNEYYMEGQMGIETVENRIMGKTIMKGTYDHVTKHQVAKLFSRIRMMYKRTAYSFMGVDPQSQEAFELARQGAPRPKIVANPLVYNVELRKFEPPYLTLNLQCIGETDEFLRGFMNEVGRGLSTLACPRRLRRTRQGPFSVEHALLDKHFQLPNLIKNVLMCNRIVDRALEENSEVIQVKSSDSVESKALVEHFMLGIDSLEEPSEEEEDCMRLPWGRDYG